MTAFGYESRMKFISYLEPLASFNCVFWTSACEETRASGLARDRAAKVQYRLSLNKKVHAIQPKPQILDLTYPLWPDQRIAVPSAISGRPSFYPSTRWRSTFGDRIFVASRRCPLLRSSCPALRCLSGDSKGEPSRKTAPVLHFLLSLLFEYISFINDHAFRDQSSC